METMSDPMIRRLEVLDAKLADLNSLGATLVDRCRTFVLAKNRRNASPMDVIHDRFVQQHLDSVAFEMEEYCCSTDLIQVDTSELSSQIRENDDLESQPIDAKSITETEASIQDIEANMETDSEPSQELTELMAKMESPDSIHKMESTSLSALGLKRTTSNLESACVVQPQVSISVLESGHRDNRLGDFEMDMVIADQQLVVTEIERPISVDLHLDIAKICEKSLCVTSTPIVYHVFDKMHLRRRSHQSKKKLLAPKSWRFKYKSGSQKKRKPNIQLLRLSMIKAQRVRWLRTRKQSLLLKYKCGYVLAEWYNIQSIRVHWELPDLMLWFLVSLWTSTKDSSGEYVVWAIVADTGEDKSDKVAGTTSTNKFAWIIGLKQNVAVIVGVLNQKIIPLMSWKFKFKNRNYQKRRNLMYSYQTSVGVGKKKSPIKSPIMSEQSHMSRLRCNLLWRWDSGGTTQLINDDVTSQRWPKMNNRVSTEERIILLMYLTRDLLQLQTQQRQQWKPFYKSRMFKYKATGWRLPLYFATWVALTLYSFSVWYW